MVVDIIIEPTRVVCYFPYIYCEYSGPDVDIVFGPTLEQAIDEVKGTCLCAIGQCNKVPDIVEFRIKHENKQTT